MFLTDFDIVRLFYFEKQYRGGSRIFFRRGCSRLLLYFNTNKPHSSFFFFFFRIPVILENRRSSQGGRGGGAHPPHPPPRSAPDTHTTHIARTHSALRRALQKGEALRLLRTYLVKLESV